eukprot:Skav223522  [mRNA]  locus=scaffold1160:308762:314465:+ [translate_table: standard]
MVSLVSSQEVDFNKQLSLPGTAARASVRFLCGQDGRKPIELRGRTGNGRLVPGDAFSLDGRTLQVASGTVQVLEPTECTIVLSDGVVNSQSDGLPSMPVDFGEFFFFLKECRLPQPKLVHWIRTTENFTCTLTRTDLFSVPQDAPIKLGCLASAAGSGLSSMQIPALWEIQLMDGVMTSKGRTLSTGVYDLTGRMLTLNIEGLLQEGRFYQLEISSDSVIDYGSLFFAGLSGDQYKFKTTGTFQEVTKIGAIAQTLPTAAVVGIIAGAVILVLTGCLLCYKGYIAASEKHDDEDGKKGPPPVFGEDALRDMQIDQLPETPDARPMLKQGAVLFAFDDGDDGDKLRETAMLEA